MLKMKRECDQEIKREKDRGIAGSPEVCCQEEGILNWRIINK
jgi:hypothetical protein